MARKRKEKEQSAQPEQAAPSPAAEPLPAPLVHAIWLHQIVFNQLPRGDTAWWIWYERHAAYCRELEVSPHYHSYLHYRKLYTDASYARANAREDLLALGDRIQEDKQSFRLALLACEDAIDQAREELDRAEEFVSFCHRLMSEEKE